MPLQTRPLDRLAPFPILLAPMVGLTHWAVREALRVFLPPGARTLWPTEMLSSRRIPSQRAEQSPELFFRDAPFGLCPQILGNDEIFIRDSIQKLEAWGASAVDINMGCPVQKALQHNYGVALMGDPLYAAQVVEFAVKYARVPVSVKLRAGLQKDTSFLVNFTQGLQAAGAAWITLHPRVASQGRKGQPDVSQIQILKERLAIPVVGNGDVQSAQAAERMILEVGCDRVMMGRALVAKPWILSQFQEINGVWKARPDTLDPQDQKNLFKAYVLNVLHLMEENYQEPQGTLRRFRFFIHHASVFINFGHFLVSQSRRAKNLEELRGCLEEFFKHPLSFSKEALLR